MPLRIPHRPSQRPKPLPIRPEGQLLFPLKLINANGKGNEVFITCNSQLNINIQFHGPPLVDILINLFLDSLGEAWLRYILQSKINEFNFKILDLGMLSLFKGKYGWLTRESVRNDSFMIELSDNKG